MVEIKGNAKNDHPKSSVEESAEQKIERLMGELEAERNSASISKSKIERLENENEELKNRIDKLETTSSKLRLSKMKMVGFRLLWISENSFPSLFFTPFGIPPITDS